MCKCAKASGMTNNGNNCHSLDEDWPFWGKRNVPRWAKSFPTKTDNCSALMDLYHERNITFEANENFMPNEGALCSNFENVIIMRSPIHRIASNLVAILSREATEATVGEDMFARRMV